MIAYADASMLNRHRAAVAALVGQVPHSRVTAVQNVQHAELTAAGLAIEVTPMGTALTLHTDCQLTADCLRRPNFAPERHRQLAEAIAELQDARRIQLTVRQIPSNQNLAHKVAYQAALTASQAGHPESTHRLRFTRKGDNFEIHGLGLTRTAPHHGQPAILLLTTLAPSLPEDTAIQVRGLGALASSMWQKPDLADPQTAYLIAKTKVLLNAQNTRLFFR